MRKIILFVVVCLLTGTSASYAQLTKEQLKERKEIVKASKAQLNDKASKTARKEAKKMKKEDSGGSMSCPNDFFVHCTFSLCTDT